VDAALYDEVEDRGQLVRVSILMIFVMKIACTYNSWQKQIEIPQDQVDEKILCCFCGTLPSVHTSGRHDELLKGRGRDNQSLDIRHDSFLRGRWRFSSISNILPSILMSVVDQQLSLLALSQSSSYSQNLHDVRTHSNQS
jgi:hypothetical protein